MINKLKLPEILNIPPKLYPLITEFDKKLYFLLEGGRGSGKTQAVARFILYICEKRIVKVCCGREIQRTIEHSVKSVFDELIRKYNLNWTIKDKELIHNETGSKIFFQGFREQGSVSIKGLDGVDILWIDEAQAITKPTLDVIIPTIIRKNNSKVIFTMNRFVRSDAVYNFFVGREDCLHININYFDNPFLNKEMLNEANVCKEKNIKDYNHIWLGEPMSQANEFLFDSDKLQKAKNLEFTKDNFLHLSVMSVDLAASGGDLCVAKFIEKKSLTQWEETKTVTWSEADTDITKGKIINLHSQWQPNILILDADGLGYSIWVSITKVISDCIGFRGAAKSNIQNAGNRRADGYIALNEFVENNWLKINNETTIKQLEYLKKTYKPNGLIYIQDKKEIRKEQSESPDFADSLMMGIWAIKYCAYLFSKNTNVQNCYVVKSDFDPFSD